MAPVSGDEIVHFSLNNTVMKSLSIYPSQWNKHICIRIELYGCVPGMFTGEASWVLLATRIHFFLSADSESEPDESDFTYDFITYDPVKTRL